MLTTNQSNENGVTQGHRSNVNRTIISPKNLIHQHPVEFKGNLCITVTWEWVTGIHRFNCAVDPKFGCKLKRLILSRNQVICAIRKQ